MDTSRDIIESNRPPRPPRPGRSEDQVAPPVPRLVPVVVALAAVACAAFTGITAWETHRDRVNSELIYCTFYVDSFAQGEGIQQSDSDVQRSRALADGLDC